MSKARQSSLVTFLLASGNRKDAIIASFSEDMLVYTTSKNKTLINQVLSHVQANLRKPENRAILKGLESVCRITGNDATPLYEGYSGAHSRVGFNSLPVNERERYLALHNEAMEKFTAVFAAALEKPAKPAKAAKPKTSTFTIDSIVNAITQKSLSDEDIEKIKLAIASIEQPVKPIRKKTSVPA